MRMTAQATLIALSFAVLPVLAEAADAPRYTITDLGTLGGTTSYARSLNNVGQIVGWAETSAGSQQAFIWQNGQMRPLHPIAGATAGDAWSINDNGTVVGTNNGWTANDYHAVVWQSGNDVASRLFSDAANSEALGINNQGNMVGQLSGQGFLLLDGAPQLLGDYAPEAINAHSASVGAIGNAAFYHDGQQLHEINGLGGERHWAIGINDAGKVTGESELTSGESHAFLWSLDGITQDLGALQQDWLSRGRDINNNDEVVGLSLGYEPFARAFIWSQTYGMQDLNALVLDLAGWNILEEATAINDLGQIVGHGWTVDGQQHAFLLTPAEVPLPGAAWLFGSAVLAAAVARRKQPG